MMRFIVWAVVLAALGLGACGGGESEGPATTQITAVLEDFTFRPDLWRVPAGREITLDLTNRGSVEHEWVLLSEPIELEADFTENLVLFEAEAEKGAEATVTFTAPEAGRYQVVCVVRGHFAAGMKGELVVEG